MDNTIGLLDDGNDDEEELDNYLDQPKREQPKREQPTFKLTIEGLTEEQIVNIAIQRLVKKVETSFTSDHDKRIKAAIEQQVTAAVERIVETRLDTEISKIIDEGWEERGKWGEKTGNRFTLAQKVTEFLREKVDTYGRAEYNGVPRATRLMQKAVEELFTKELKTELDGAKQRVKKMVDDEVMVRLAKTLKEALGLT
jgi:hypothetical protein